MVDGALAVTLSVVEGLAQRPLPACFDCAQHDHDTLCIFLFKLVRLTKFLKLRKSLVMAVKKGGLTFQSKP